MLDLTGDYTMSHHTDPFAFAVPCFIHGEDYFRMLEKLKLSPASPDASLAQSKADNLLNPCDPFVNAVPCWGHETVFEPKLLLTFETEQNHFFLLNTGLLESDVYLDLGRWFIEDCIAEAIEILAQEQIGVM
jgi:hypothetical protein